MPVQLYPYQVKALEETKDFNRVLSNSPKKFVISQKLRE